MARVGVDGLLVLDKPRGFTSRAAVNRAQRWFPRGTRLGHTGTLDPLATGVLVLCAGQATRLAEYVQAMEKVYRTTLRLGQRSSTDDADGEISSVVVDRPPDEAVLRQTLTEFLGEIDQVPPAFSAARITGRRAYDLARAGAAVSLQPRRVRIYDLRVLSYEYPRLELEVRCGKGTYIRSLARDLGTHLGCGALVETLRRTRVGAFTVETAVSLEAEPALARQRLLPLESAVAELPHRTLPSADLDRLRHGQALTLAGTSIDLHPGQEVALFDAQGWLAAVARLDGEARTLQPQKVLAAPSGG
ncbi:MAG TPA: tRNA pseudouridine(55) synthase TruB [Gemmataceae bacterium]|nr:tRNA pseudouridine(55) synthase TruB [Gemmataceae bacterium]